MDNECRGKFYINIEPVVDGSLKDELLNFKNEIGRLGFEAMKTPKGVPFKNYIKDDLYAEGGFVKDDCMALLYCIPREEIKDEFEILNLFQFFKGHGLYMKPRILFIIYEIELVPRSLSINTISHDSEYEYKRAIQEDMIIIRADVSDVLQTIKIFTKTLSTIKNTYLISVLYQYTN